MNEPTQRFPLLIVPQPAPTMFAASSRFGDGDLEADDHADKAGRDPYLHILHDGDEDLLDDEDDDEDGPDDDDGDLDGPDDPDDTETEY